MDRPHLLLLTGLPEEEFRVEGDHFIERHYATCDIAMLARSNFDLPPISFTFDMPVLMKKHGRPLPNQ